MNLFVKIFLFLALLQVAGNVCAQPVPTAAFPFKMTVEQYIEKYAQLAVDEMHRSRIPASITLAQGLLESGNGNSRLAIMGNNHFGIKCKAGWTGDTLKEDDDEAQECFRKYASPFDSYKDHSDFLMKGQRYAFLFDLEPTDYKAWAHGLKRAGYATNPRYGEILIATIERNNLQRFDLIKPTVVEQKILVAEKKEAVAEQKQLTINQIPAVVVKLGDSYTAIALSNDLKIWQLYKYNDLAKNAQIRVGDTLYIKPKNYKALVETHTIEVNETMHQLSQRYAVKLSRLLKYNNLKEGQEPANGQVIYLRSKRVDQVQLRIQDAPASNTDSAYNNQVYPDAKKNIETSIPVLPEDTYNVEAHGVKDDMAFFHTVQAGETLFSIAKKYNVQVDGIKSLNKLVSDQIQIGARLIINPNQPAIQPNEESVIPGYHEVKQGETLYSIAKLYNITLIELKALNDLSSDTIRVGEELIVVPLNGERAKEEVVTDNPNEPLYHLVKEKETLYSISRKYAVTPEHIRRLNKLIDNHIEVGAKLQIR
ncbi:MAG: LysM peptidoglycan-binding domain-containing protein [Bacteroidia bacterium]|nr:LysM peptidoglycan-binding domain-containing protein [Bacteroidia bacterium]